MGSVGRLRAGLAGAKLLGWGRSGFLLARGSPAKPWYSGAAGCSPPAQNELAANVPEESETLL